MVGMEIPTLLLLILLALCLFVGFVLGYARAILRSTERERSGQAQSQAAEWQAKAAEASGRADVLERENAELAERARSDQSLAQMITPLSAQLRSMTEQVTAMQTRQASHDAAIREQLSHAAQTSEKLAHETASLSRALTSVSARGGRSSCVGSSRPRACSPTWTSPNSSGFRPRHEGPPTYPTPPRGPI